MDESSRCLTQLQCGAEEASAGDWFLVLARIAILRVDEEFWLSNMAAWWAYVFRHYGPPTSIDNSRSWLRKDHLVVSFLAMRRSQFYLILPSSSVIENVLEFCEQKPTSRGYAYFFFDGTRAQTETLTYESLLRSIIAQLSDRCGDTIPGHMVRLVHHIIVSTRF